MSVAGLDHVAITVDDVGVTVAWYERVLGATPLHFDLWLAGQMPVALLQVGASRLSVHPAAKPASPHARRPTPGSADLCFRWEGPIETALDLLNRNGVAVVDGPVPRPAANGERGTSVYFRDPDGNLLELLTTSPQSLQTREI
jgi:catechol 2,3-dioxygenase-like lactoylglutathione lyase family enzyme